MFDAIERLTERIDHPRATPTSLHHGADGRWHNAGCQPHIQDAGGSFPPLTVLLGLTPGLCGCVTLSGAIGGAASLLNEYRSFPDPTPLPVSRRPDDTAHWARAMMGQRRRLSEFADRLRAWLEDTGDDAQLIDLGEGLLAVHSELVGRWQQHVQSEEARDLLRGLATSETEAVIALDQYRSHVDPTLDGDIADCIVSAFTLCRTDTRVALRLPLALASFVALHRNPDGFTEADRDGSTPRDVVETALVLWSPDQEGPYRRWPQSLAAARLLR